MSQTTETKERTEIESAFPLYENMISPRLLERLAEDSVAVQSCPGLSMSAQLLEEPSSLETAAAQQFICQLYEHTASHLKQILRQRVLDRSFMDEVTLSCVSLNQETDYLSPQYKTVLGAHDAQKRLVVGPHPKRVEILLISLSRSPLGSLEIKSPSLVRRTPKKCRLTR